MKYEKSQEGYHFHLGQVSVCIESCGIKNKVSLGHCWSLLTEAREGTSYSMLDNIFLLLYSQRYVSTCFGGHVTNKKTINFVG